MSAIAGTTVTTVFGNVDLLSHILHYTISDTNEVPAIAATCRQFNYILNVNLVTSCGIWRNICASQQPNIIPIYDLCKEPATHLGGGEWKVLLRRAMTSSFKPRGCNELLQKKFELVFKEEGIVAYWEDSYQNDADFILRKRGINWFGFDLRFGAVFILHAQVRYKDYHYLLKNWDAECDIIRRWCAVIGVAESDYTVEKPVSKNAYVIVRFKDPYALEEFMCNDFFDFDSDGLSGFHEEDDDDFEQYEYDLMEEDGFGGDRDEDGSEQDNLDYEDPEGTDDLDYDDLDERDDLDYAEVDEDDEIDQYHDEEEMDLDVEM